MKYYVTLAHNKIGSTLEMHILNNVTRENKKQQASSTIVQKEYKMSSDGFSSDYVVGYNWSVVAFF